MRIVTAVLISREVPGWPDAVIAAEVPLGKRYRVDLDSKGVASLVNFGHPEWGSVQLDTINDVEDGGFALPLCCLQLELTES